VKCQKCERDVAITHQRVVYTTVRLPPGGTPVRVPESIVVVVDCPQCGPHTQIEICNPQARSPDRRRSR
jgi:hypothetical protein